MDKSPKILSARKTFELAQKVIRGGGRNPTRKQHDYPRKGLVRWSITAGNISAAKREPSTKRTGFAARISIRLSLRKQTGNRFTLG